MEVKRRFCILKREGRTLLVAQTRTLHSPGLRWAAYGETPFLPFCIDISPLIRDRNVAINILSNASSENNRAYLADALCINTAADSTSLPAGLLDYNRTVPRISNLHC